MISILTGDITGSRKLVQQDRWMEALKGLFNRTGPRPMAWDIYRGDTFQIEVNNPEEALQMALHIKAIVRKSANTGARIAIGIGTKDHFSPRILESNGQAYVFSGDRFENLKKDKLSLAIQTPWQDINKQLNVCFRLAMIAIDSWSPVSAEYVALRLASPKKTQTDIAEMLGIKQSSVSARHTRAHFDELMTLESYYRELIQQKLQS